MPYIFLSGRATVNCHSGYVVKSGVIPFRNCDIKARLFGGLRGIKTGFKEAITFMPASCKRTCQRARFQPVRQARGKLWSKSTFVFCMFWNWIFQIWFMKNTHDFFFFFLINSQEFHVRWGMEYSRTFRSHLVMMQSNVNWYPTNRHLIQGKNREKEKLRTGWMGELNFVSVTFEVEDRVS